MKNLLQAKHLVRRDGSHTRVADISLSLGKGEIVGLLGVNGAGKSTTIAMLAGALSPTSGEIYIADKNLHRYPLQAKRYIGLLPEQPALYPELTVDENLDFAARLRGLDSNESRQARERIKANCGLDDVGRKLARNLSKGYQQRAGIAQAMIHQPDVLILDEPTVGLDPLQATDIRSLIKQASPDCAILLASHLLPDIEQLCHRVIVLDQGRVVAEQDLHTAASPTVRVHFTQLPSSINLAARAEIIECQPLADGWYRLFLGNDAPENLAETLAQNNWGMTAFIPEPLDLQTLFQHLATQGEAA